MKISVIGTGYVGLVTGAVFSIQGHEVTCVDIDEKKIEGLRRGVLPFFEPGLYEVIKLGIENACLAFSAEVGAAVNDADIVFLAVGTPASASGAANLETLFSAANSVAGLLKPGAVVVIKSTVPVGTNRLLAQAMTERAGRTIDVASNPEFLREGSAVDDCLNPDRIVLGVRSERVAEVLQHLYQPLTASAQRPCSEIVMDPESAEMTKYAANCMLASKISFINEIANLCEELGADVEWVREGICSDRRIGRDFLKPGVGYGGSCFPKDVKALISQAEQVGYQARMLEAIDQVNTQQKTVMARKILAHFGGDLRGKRIAVWGLAFKPETDDIREAPSLALIQMLLEWGADVHVHDPQAMENVRRLFADQLRYHTNKLESLKSADALVVMTEWKEYIGADPGVLRWYMNEPVVFDGRNCLNRDWFEPSSFTYFSIGQAPTGIVTRQTSQDADRESLLRDEFFCLDTLEPAY
jgi:UDPglucose 6-dehydrogenase